MEAPDYAETDGSQLAASTSTWITEVEICTLFRVMWPFVSYGWDDHRNIEGIVFLRSDVLLADEYFLGIDQQALEAMHRDDILYAPLNRPYKSLEVFVKRDKDPVVEMIEVAFQLESIPPTLEGQIVYVGLMIRDAPDESGRVFFSAGAMTRLSTYTYKSRFDRLFGPFARPTETMFEFEEPRGEFRKLLTAAYLAHQVDDLELQMYDGLFDLVEPARKIKSKLSRVVHRRRLSSEEHAKQCSICLDAIGDGTDWNVIVTKCSTKHGHYFHHDCARQWLEEHWSCPNCREPAYISQRSSEAVEDVMNR